MIADEKHKEQRHGATEVEANAEAGKSILLLQGKSRLSHVRHQARSISTQSVQEVHEGRVLCHMGHQNFEGKLLNFCMAYLTFSLGILRNGKFALWGKGPTVEI